MAAAIALGRGRCSPSLGCGGGGPGLWVAREPGRRWSGSTWCRRPWRRPGPGRAGSSRTSPRGSCRATSPRCPSPMPASTRRSASPSSGWCRSLGVPLPRRRGCCGPGRASPSPTGAAPVRRPACCRRRRPPAAAGGGRVPGAGLCRVAGAEARRRQVYARYLDRQEALRREMGLEAAATLVREANRALGRLDGVDHLANSRLVLAAAERWPDGRGAPGGRGAGPSHPLRPHRTYLLHPNPARSGAHCPRSGGSGAPSR